MTGLSHVNSKMGPSRLNNISCIYCLQVLLWGGFWIDVYLASKLNWLRVKKINFNHLNHPHPSILKRKWTYFYVVAASGLRRILAA